MRFRQIAFTCLALALAAAGCGFEPPTSASLALPASHVVTAESAGPVSPGTPYSTAAMRRLFPGARLETIRTADESGVISAITVFEDGLQVFQIIPATGGQEVRAVHGSGLAVTGPNGERLGATFAATGASRDQCRVGTGLWAAMAVCPAQGAPNVMLVFDNAGWNGPATELPPRARLAEAQLQRIVWTPPASS